MPPEREREIALAILEACREVKSLFHAEQAGVAAAESAPELARYRRSLEAGLNRLAGKWKEALETPPERPEGDERD